MTEREVGAKSAALHQKEEEMTKHAMAIDNPTMGRPFRKVLTWDVEDVLVESW